MFKVWYSTKTFADYIIDNTCLRAESTKKCRLYESDANNPNNFHRMPDHIKKILYLDAPDIIVDYNGEPVFSIELSGEAGTGHNAFQRFARLAASVESGVPAIYIYPQAVFISRIGDASGGRWDRINPNIFKALEKVMQIYDIPALLFYYPTDYPGKPNIATKGKKISGVYPSCPEIDSEMRKMFEIINLMIQKTKSSTPAKRLVKERLISDRRLWMQSEFVNKGGNERMWSPETAAIEVPTQALLKYIEKFTGKYTFGDLISQRGKSVLYQVDARFRGDPYPGALAALDYMRCRVGETYEDRDMNLVLVWGSVSYDKDEGALEVSSDKTSVEDFVAKVKPVREIPVRCLLNRGYSQLRKDQIPRYYMQTRYGCSFTKNKEIRAYAYFADAILFSDGALWRDE